jgi:chromosomal replication initiation ATPase DnaA
VQTYQAFVEAGYQHGHRGEFYGAVEGRLLGGEEFVGEVKHRIGEAPIRRAKKGKQVLGWESVVGRVEEVLGVRLEQVQGRGRTSTHMKAKEMLIYLGRERGEVSQKELAKRLEIDQSNVARGYERARERMQREEEFRNLVERIVAEA